MTGNPGCLEETNGHSRILACRPLPAGSLFKKKERERSSVVVVIGNMARGAHLRKIEKSGLYYPVIIQLEKYLPRVPMSMSRFHVALFFVHLSHRRRS